MDKFIALLQFVLALFGLDAGGHTVVQRIDGEAAGLHSRTHIEAGVTRFECLRSASGQCHYVLYPRDCIPSADATSPGHCEASATARFALASGDSRQLIGHGGDRLCVGADADPAQADCQRL